MNPIPFILGNKMLIIGALALIAFAGLSTYVVVLRGNVAELTAEKNLLSAKLEVSNSSISSLEQAIQDQNTAVEKLKQAAESRFAANAEELKKAQQAARVFKDKADRIINTPAPPGVDTCTAANALINQEIQDAKK